MVLALVTGRPTHSQKHPRTLAPRTSSRGCGGSFSLCLDEVVRRLRVALTELRWDVYAVPLGSVVRLGRDGRAAAATNAGGGGASVGAER